MNIEDDLTRQLHAKAATVRPSPDLGDLFGRIGARERSTRRHERLSVGAAVIVLAASLGGRSHPGEQAEQFGADR